MRTDGHHPWIHALAWLTAVIALLPIGVGAVVTTVDAGMAFADWPTSDGHGMLAYPWLKSAGDKFLEHGHRLAGMTIGVMSLVLAAAAFASECRGSVKAVAAGIVAGVVCQGLLGGWRVQFDEKVVALLHGNFAAWVLSLIGVLIAMTGRSWSSQPPLADATRASAALAWGVGAVATVFAQMLLGGLLRHLGWATAWLWHPWFALAVLIAAAGFGRAAFRTESAAIRRGAAWFVGFVVCQALLGLATWGVKYGYPQWGLVAVQSSPLHVGIRSLHTVVGLLTLTTAVVGVVRVWHVLPALERRPAGLTVAGGVA